MKLTPGLTLLLCLLVFPLTACMPKAGEDGGPEHAEIYYIDVPNGFAMEYPADWTRVRRSPSSVAWHPPTEEGGAAEIMVRVTSISPSKVPGGDDRMLSDFVSARSGFVITSEEQMEHPGGMPALRVIGRTPNHVIIVYFITTRLRAFILEFSATPKLFDAYRSTFTEMADSFRVLE